MTMRDSVLEIVKEAVRDLSKSVGGTADINNLLGGDGSNLIGGDGSILKGGDQ